MKNKDIETINKLSHYRDFYLRAVEDNIIGDRDLNDLFDTLLSPDDRVMYLHDTKYRVEIFQVDWGHKLGLFISHLVSGKESELKEEEESCNYKYFFTEKTSQPFENEDDESSCGDGEHFCKVQYISFSELEEINSKLSKAILGLKEELLNAQI